MATDSGTGLHSVRGLGWVHWLVLAALWFATVPWHPLFEPDEGRYAEVPREMVASGDWITPRLNDLKYFEKPPLQYWATAALYSVFGLSEWTARLWTVGLAFLCLPLVFAWTSRLYGYAAGCAALIALAVSPYFALIGHLNLLDAGFTFWVSGTVFAFTLAQSAAVGSPAERRWMGLSWAAAALAVLSKGLAVGVLVGLTLVLYSLIERDVRVWRRLHVGVGLPLFLALAAPWFLAVSWRNAAFPEFFFVHEHFVRFLTTVHQRTEPWWYFGPILLIGVLPWLGRALGTVRDAWVDSEADQTFKPLKFLALFSIVTVLFFSLSGSKLAPYILPAIPPLAALAGARVSSYPRFLQRTARASGALLLLAAAGLAL
jgi:4-amino-4-deoxy-L-arabinose transferase-like glycosyltransferase